MDIKRFQLFSIGLAAKARSQSPYIPYQAREQFEKRIQQQDSESDRRGRSVSRSSSMRKRDSSWDKKWVEQVKRNKEEDGVNLIMKREASPGRLNDGLSFWEHHSRQQTRLAITC